MDLEWLLPFKSSLGVPPLVVMAKGMSTGNLHHIAVFMDAPMCRKPVEGELTVETRTLSLVLSHQDVQPLVVMDQATNLECLPLTEVSMDVQGEFLWTNPKMANLQVMKMGLGAPPLAVTVQDTELGCTHRTEVFQDVLLQILINHSHDRARVHQQHLLTRKVARLNISSQTRSRQSRVRLHQILGFLQLPALKTVR